MKQNVVKLKFKSPVNEDLVLIQNLQQIVDALVLKHGAQLVMANFPSVVQTAQTKARALKSQGQAKQKKVIGSK